MPATFAHCLIASHAMSQLSKDTPFAGLLKMNNNFVIMGAAGPDYPYLTDVITYGVLHIGHNWSNRMHYENTRDFIKFGVESLAEMDKNGPQFPICLSWFAGYVSHVIADSYVHPVINSITGGTYIFTHVEHGHCELVQDIYIFKRKKEIDIIEAAPNDDKTFGYLNILDDCSDSANLDKIHPDLGDFWVNLLKKAHPHAFDYFTDIDPNEWHKNYKKRVDFVADARSIFRHVLNIVDAPRYFAEKDIVPIDRNKYIDQIRLPNGKTTSYEQVFQDAVDRVVSEWADMLSGIANFNESTTIPAKDWNLDTGVDESKIDLWKEEA